jgi:flavodoxin I
VATLFEVVYYSRGGSTRKIAEAIASELEIEAADLKTKKELAKDSFVFLGTGHYFPITGRAFKQFIARNDFDGRKVALFGTSGRGKGSEVAILEKMVTARGARVVGKFNCRGKFLFFLRGHPTAEDLEKAKRFASEMRRA